MAYSAHSKTTVRIWAMLDGIFPERLDLNAEGGGQSLVRVSWYGVFETDDLRAALKELAKRRLRNRRTYRGGVRMKVEEELSVVGPSGYAHIEMRCSRLPGRVLLRDKRVSIKRLVRALAVIDRMNGYDPKEATRLKSDS